VNPRLFEPLFDTMPIGLVVLDSQGRVVVYNRQEEILAGRQRTKVMGKSFFTEVAPCMDVRELAGVFRDGMTTGDLEERVELSFPFPHAKPRDVVVRLRSFESEGERYGVLLVEDVSAQRAVERLRETLSTLLVHDMKNPLAAVLALVDLAKGKIDQRKDPQIAGPLGEAYLAGKRLQGMIHDLLDITRFQIGTFPVLRNQTNLAQVIREAARAAEPMANRSNKRLSVDVPEVVLAAVDEKVLRRVLDNLIDNAVRYAPTGSLVQIGAATLDAEIVIEVRDQGPGVPMALREKIFEMYVRADPEVQQVRGNEGLGLTFVNLAVRNHGGKVEVTSNAPNGSIFRVRLPAN
jgi:photoactive yellow protein